MKLLQYLVLFTISSTLFACASIDKTDKKIVEQTKNIEKYQVAKCSSSDARSAALRRLWKLYGKDNIRLPYKVKSMNDASWNVFGYRNNVHNKTVHVIIPKNNKNCTISKIEHKSIRVCTLIGCNNRIKVNLPKKLVLKPDNYLIKVKFDNKKSDLFEIPISDTFTDECKKNNYSHIRAKGTFRPSSRIY